MELAKKLLALQAEYAAGEQDAWGADDEDAGCRTLNEVAADYADTLRKFLSVPA